MKRDLVVHGGTALLMDDRNSVVEHAVIRVKDGEIESVVSDVGYVAAHGDLDARGCLVMPGLVNGHTHTGMTFLRGIADDYPLHRWLNEAIFPLEKKWGSYDFVYQGTRLAIAEMIRSGTTTFNDMYYFEEAAARAVHETGVRAVCGQTLVEISHVEKGRDLFAKFDEYLDKIKGFDRVTPAVAPHSIYGVSDASWKRVVEYVAQKDLMVHVHLAETQEEEDQCQKTHGMTPTEYFDRIGLWSQRAVAAHGTCLTEKEIEILGRRRVGVVNNPESNLKLGTRICPVVELREAGAFVALGTDGTASNNDLDLFREADTAAKLQIFRKGIGVLKAPDVVRMLTIEGARALGLGDRIGSLEKGKCADLIAVDLRKPHLQPLYNPYSHLVYAATGADVKHTVVDGRVLMRDRALTTIDEGALLDEAMRWGDRIRTST